MTYSNANATISQISVYNNQPIYYDTIDLLQNIPHNAQLEIERIFSEELGGGTQNLLAFLLDPLVPISRKRSVFLIPTNLCTFEPTTKKILTVNLSGFVVTYTPPGSGTYTIAVPPLTVGNSITVRRKTINNFPIVSWTAGTKITTPQLNLAIKQAIFLSQEILDRVYNQLSITTDYATLIPILDGAVTEDKILAGSITASKLSADSVIETRILDGAITTNKILNGAIVTDKISGGAVTTAVIANGAVTPIKLSPVSATWSLLGSLVVSGPATVTGDLTVSGSLAVTGTVSAAYPTAANHLTTLAYVNFVSNPVWSGAWTDRQVGSLVLASSNFIPTTIYQTVYLNILSPYTYIISLNTSAAYFTLSGTWQVFSTAPVSDTLWHVLLQRIS